jgi:hypothetical protein
MFLKKFYLVDTHNHELVYASVSFIIVALIGGIWPRAKRAWRNK